MVKKNPNVKNQFIPKNQRASGGIRTPDQLITNQLLWPTELHWHLKTPTTFQELSQKQPQGFFWEGKGNGKTLMEKL